MDTPFTAPFPRLFFGLADNLIITKRAAGSIEQEQEVEKWRQEGRKKASLHSRYIPLRLDRERRCQDYMWKGAVPGAKECIGLCGDAIFS